MKYEEYLWWVLQRSTSYFSHILSWYMAFRLERKAGQSFGWWTPLVTLGILSPRASKELMLNWRLIWLPQLWTWKVPHTIKLFYIGLLNIWIMIQNWLLLAPMHLINVKDLFFSALVGKVHPYALKKSHEQLRKLSHPLSQCSGTFCSAQGLPCAHDLLSLRQRQVHIPLQSRHGHWHFDQIVTGFPLLELPDTVIILDLVLAQPRGRPQGALKGGGD